MTDVAAEKRKALKKKKSKRHERKRQDRDRQKQPKQTLNVPKNEVDGLIESINRLTLVTKESQERNQSYNNFNNSYPMQQDNFVGNVSTQPPAHPRPYTTYPNNIQPTQHRFNRRPPQQQPPFRCYGCFSPDHINGRMSKVA